MLWTNRLEETSDFYTRILKLTCLEKKCLGDEGICHYYNNGYLIQFGQELED